MDYYSTKQVAEILGIKPQRLQAAVWDGRISTPAKGPGGNFHWEMGDIETAGRILGRLSQYAEWQVREGVSHESP